MKKLVFIIPLLCLLVGCEVEANPMEEKSIFKRVHFEYQYGYSREIYVDIETGVEYIVFDSSKGTGITPLYNADGTLKIWSEKE